MLSERLWKASVAAGGALLLLAAGGSTQAQWQQVEPMRAASVTAGALHLTAAAPTYRLTRTDLVPGATTMSDVATSTTVVDPTTTPLAPGDTLAVSTTITTTVRGQNNKAVLTVSPAALTGAGDMAAELSTNGSPVTVTPVGAAPALTSAGTNTWLVTPASDGRQYVVTVTLKVRPTRDGKPMAADATNWWGPVLQGDAVAARSIGVTLDQVL